MQQKLVKNASSIKLQWGGFSAALGKANFLVTP
jgi:hypothetical protein